MHPVLKKLNVKNEAELVVLNTPSTFSSAVKDWAIEYKITEWLNYKLNSAEFVLTFVQEIDVLENIVPLIDAVLIEDGLFWVAYPKKSSKRYKSNINRDAGWESLGKLGYEGVRLVALDDDWSALRFRKVQYIKSLQRNSKLAISQEAKLRIGNPKGTKG